MRTFVQVYLLTILAMKRIQNFFELQTGISDLLALIMNLEFCSSLIMHHGQKWKLEIEN